MTDPTRTPGERDEDKADIERPRPVESNDAGKTPEGPASGGEGAAGAGGSNGFGTGR